MPNQIRVSHILVKTKPEADEIIQDLAHGTPFAKLAEMHSLCPSRKKGGDLGTFGRGQMVREFEKAAFALEKNQTSESIKTEFGWHVIRRTG